MDKFVSKRFDYANLSLHQMLAYLRPVVEFVVKCNLNIKLRALLRLFILIDLCVAVSLQY